MGSAASRRGGRPCGAVRREPDDMPRWRRGNPVGAPRDSPTTQASDAYYTAPRHHGGDAIENHAHRTLPLVSCQWSGTRNCTRRCTSLVVTGRESVRSRLPRSVPSERMDPLRSRAGPRQRHAKESSPGIRTSPVGLVGEWRSNDPSIRSPGYLSHFRQWLEVMGLESRFECAVPERRMGGTWSSQPCDDLSVGTKCTDFIPSTDVETVRTVVEKALLARKFRVTWLNGATADAERGSKLANAIAGDFATYMKVGIRLHEANAGETALRLEKLSTGRIGGGFGGTRTKRNFQSLCKQLGQTFRDQGVLISTQDAWDDPGRKSNF